MADVSSVYVSAAGAGCIDVFSLCATTGVLTPRGSVEAAPLVMPLAVSPNRQRLYAAVRTEPYRILSFAIAANDGALTLIGEAPTNASMANIATDRSGRFLFAASYGDSSISVSRIDAAGAVDGWPVQVVSTGRHAHAIGIDRRNRTVYVPCLGSDEIVVAAFDEESGRLEARPSLAAPLAVGEGPRHFRLSVDNRFLYVLCELSGNVAQFMRDDANGGLHMIGSTPTLPPSSGLVRGRISAPISAAVPAQAASDDGTAPPIWAADLHLTPDGRFLYVSERTTSTLAHLSIDPIAGTPHYVGRIATERQPRAFAIDPTGRWLVAAGEKSDHLALYRIGEVSGALTLSARVPVGAGACWVEIVARSASL